MKSEYHPTLFRASQPGLHQLLLEATSMPERAEVVRLERQIKRLSDALRGLARRRETNARDWSEIVVRIDDLHRDCPRELHDALGEALSYASVELKRLAPCPECFNDPIGFARAFCKGPRDTTSSAKGADRRTSRQRIGSVRGSDRCRAAKFLQQDGREPISRRSAV